MTRDRSRPDADESMDLLRGRMGEPTHWSDRLLIVVSVMAAAGLVLMLALLLIWAAEASAALPAACDGLPAAECAAAMEDAR